MIKHNPISHNHLCIKRKKRTFLYPIYIRSSEEGIQIYLRFLFVCTIDCFVILSLDTNPIMDTTTDLVNLNWDELLIKEDNVVRWSAKGYFLFLSSADLCVVLFQLVVVTSQNGFLIKAREKIHLVTSDKCNHCIQLVEIWSTMLKLKTIALQSIINHEALNKLQISYLQFWHQRPPYLKLVPIYPYAVVKITGMKWYIGSKYNRSWKSASIEMKRMAFIAVVTAILVCIATIYQIFISFCIRITTFLTC